MSRVKRGMMHVKRRRNILKRTKGYRWGSRKLIKRAKVAMMRAGAFAYRDRKVKKREARKLWTIQLNAAVREQGLNYSAFINKLKKANVALDRKVLSQLAREYPAVFKAILEKIK